MDIITPSVLAVKPIKEIEFCGWIGQAAPGDVLQYHRGHLALDVTTQGTRLPERERSSALLSLGMNRIRAVIRRSPQATTEAGSVSLIVADILYMHPHEHKRLSRTCGRRKS